MDLSEVDESEKEDSMDEDIDLEKALIKDYQDDSAMIPKSMLSKIIQTLLNFYYS